MAAGARSPPECQVAIVFEGAINATQIVDRTLANEWRGGHGEINNDYQASTGKSISGTMGPAWASPGIARTAVSIPSYWLPYVARTVPIRKNSQRGAGR